MKQNRQIQNSKYKIYYQEL